MGYEQVKSQLKDKYFLHQMFSFPQLHGDVTLLNVCLVQQTPQVAFSEHSMCEASSILNITQ